MDRLNSTLQPFAIHACRGGSLGVTTTGVVIGLTETSFRVQIFEDKKIIDIPFDRPTMENLFKKTIQRFASQFRVMHRDLSIEQATQYAKREVFESWPEISVDFIGLEGLSNEDYFLHDGSMSRPGPVFGRYFDFFFRNNK